MKGMIFAAGLGTRLRPLTDHTPKALIPLGGRPMLERVIERMQLAGVTDLTVNVHHHAAQVIDWLQAHPRRGLILHISDERDELLDTGGGLFHARPFLEEGGPILVHNADILTDVDLTAIVRYHQASQALATLLVARRSTSRYLLFDSQLRLHGWVNKLTGELRPAGLACSIQPSPQAGVCPPCSATVSPLRGGGEVVGHTDSEGSTISPALLPLQEWAFGGIHVIEPDIFRLMEKDGWSGAFSLIPFYLSVCHTAHVQGYPAPADSSWFDVGKPDTLYQAEQWLQRQ